MSDWPEFRLEPGDLVPLRLVELGPGIYRTPVLSSAGCERLMNALEERRTERAGGGPNSMHEHGLVLDRVGLASVVDALLDAHAGGSLRAAIAERYADFGGADLDHHHSYLVEYGKGLDDELGFHVDDSEVTLNLCLGANFRGAELVMLGRRCDDHRQTPIDAAETIEIEHEAGDAVLHIGRHRHRVDPIRGGVRRNVIAWLRSSTYRAATGGWVGCGAWCGIGRGPG